MSAEASRALLRDRIAAIPDALVAAASAPFPGDLAPWRRLRRIVATGGGLSEGPARVLVALLRQAGVDARFVSQSALLDATGHEGDEHAGTGLVLFSQGLAPNARLPLPWLGPELVGARGARVFERGLLVTAVTPGEAGAPGVAGIARRLRDAGHLVWTLPPAEENGLLLRVLGPAVAIVAALRLAEAIAPSRVIDDASILISISATAAHALGAPGPDLFGAARAPIAIVAEPELLELAMPLRWKLLEGLRVPDPPVWDPLQVAHGPLQSFHAEALTLVTLRTPGPRYDGLFARLASLLQPRHRLVELRASSSAPGALIELDARLDAALLATLARHPLALDEWPCRGEDGAIYDVDPLVLDKERP